MPRRNRHDEHVIRLAAAWFLVGASARNSISPPVGVQDLLAVDHPVIAIALGRVSQGGEVGAARLAEPMPCMAYAAEDFREIFLCCAGVLEHLRRSQWMLRPIRGAYERSMVSIKAICLQCVERASPRIPWASPAPIQPVLPISRAKLRSELRAWRKGTLVKGGIAFAGPVLRQPNPT